MSRNVETISPETTLSDAIKKMRECRIRRLVVTSAEAVVGIVCQHDLADAFPHHVNPFSLFAMEETVASVPVQSIMNCPVITIDKTEPIEHAALLMTKHHVGGLVVIHHEKLAGIITESDIFRAFTKLLAGSGKSIRITFDITENENILSFLAKTIPKHRLTLLSFISFHDQENRIVVARIRGERIKEFVDELWTSGHLVLDIIHSSDEPGPQGK